MVVLVSHNLTQNKITKVESLRKLFIDQTDDLSYFFSKCLLQRDRNLPKNWVTPHRFLSVFFAPWRFWLICLTICSLIAIMYASVMPTVSTEPTLRHLEFQYTEEIRITGKWDSLLLLVRRTQICKEFSDKCSKCSSVNVYHTPCSPSPKQNQLCLSIQRNCKHRWFM